jgi:hypothetical protein
MVRQVTGGTPEGGQAKKPNQTGQPIYARATREGIGMAIVCEGYPGVQISRENFVVIQRAIGGLVGGFPEEGFTPRIVDSYWAKRAAIMMCQDEETRDWLSDRVPTQYSALLKLL